MVEIIVGAKGSGKSKILLDRASTDLAKANGDVVFIDKNSKHMYELDSKVRLINMSDFDIDNTDEFVGFMSGVISQNNDIEEIFLDSFLTISYADTTEGLCQAIAKLDKISDKFGVKLVMSVSKETSEIPDEIKDKVILSL